MKYRNVIMILLAVALGLSFQSQADNFPADNAARLESIVKGILKQGPEAVANLCNELVAPGTGDDTQARFAITSLARYVGSGKSESKRKMVSKAIILAIESSSDKEVTAFLIRRLQSMAKNEAVGTLSGFLTDERLCDPAAQALLAIGTPKAASAITGGLALAKGGSARATLVQAAGEMRSKNAVELITPYASSGDEMLRSVALRALANIGAPSCEKILAMAVQNNDRGERFDAASNYLLYAQRLCEGRNKKQGERICRDVIDAWTRTEVSHFRSVALATLASSRGNRGTADLMTAVDSDDERFRASALRLASQNASRTATRRWIDKAGEVSAEVKAGIVAMLGGRGDLSALPFLIESLEDEADVVRLAAIPAAAELGKRDALAALIAMLKAAEGVELEAIEKALPSISDAQDMAQVALALPNTPPSGQVVLIELITQRRAYSQIEAVYAETRNEDGSVRVAAIKALADLAKHEDLSRLIAILLDAASSSEKSAALQTVVAVSQQVESRERRATPVLAALKNAKNEERKLLLNVLAKIGGGDALRAVVADTKSDSPDLQDAAVRALAGWQDEEALPALLKIIRGTDELKHQVPAIQAYIRILAKAKMASDKKVESLAEVLAAAERPEEKRRVLSGLAKLRTLSALKVAGKCLDDESLQEDAALAAVNIACPVDAKGEGLSGAEVVAVLKRAVKFIDHEDILKRANEHLDSLE